MLLIWDHFAQFLILVLSLPTAFGWKMGEMYACIVIWDPVGRLGLWVLKASPER